MGAGIGVAGLTNQWDGLLCTCTYSSQVADAAGADGLHQLVVGRPQRRGRPAALLPSPLHRHRPQRVLELLQDAARLLRAQGLLPALLALLAFRLARLLAARLVRPDDLRDHPGGLLLPLGRRQRRRRWRGRRWRRWGRRRWSGRILPFGGEFGRGPG